MSHKVILNKTSIPGRLRTNFLLVRSARFWYLLPTGMMRTLHGICTYLLIALGVVHTALTPVFYGRLSPGAMWFAGSGLAMIFVGFLNVALGRGAGRDAVVRILCYVANLLTAVFGAMIVTVDNEPQVLFGMLLIATMTVTAFMLKTGGDTRAGG